VWQVPPEPAVVAPARQSAPHRRASETDLRARNGPTWRHCNRPPDRPEHNAPVKRRFSLARLRRDLLGPKGSSSPDIFLVGGVVRDGLDGRRHPRDIDLAVAQGEESIARRLSRCGWGKAFQIAGARQGLSVWRVAGPNGTVDVARFGGTGGLAGDLGRRDFTVNAMARELGTGRLYDPFGGRRDLRTRSIRAVSASNFDEDPLRLLRAYRLAAQLRAKIVPATRALIRVRAGALRTVAFERVRDELVPLLSASGLAAASAIAFASSDGILASALGFSDGLPLAAAPIRQKEGEDSLTDRLALLFRRAGIDSAEACRLLLARRFAGSLARRVGARLRFLEAALARRFDGRSLYRAYAEASGPTGAVLTAAAATPTERRRALRVRAWLGRANSLDLSVTGDEISTWLAIPPGPLLGAAIAEARYRYFIGDWEARREIRDGLRRWMPGPRRIDRLPGLG
jgi:tRNA nucleotidyltransferase/poly(A) polymerase